LLLALWARPSFMQRPKSLPAPDHQRPGHRVVVVSVDDDRDRSAAFKDGVPDLVDPLAAQPSRVILSVLHAEANPAHCDRRSAPSPATASAAHA
jgi:hypothetical protein